MELMLWVSAFITLLVIIDPIGLAPIFVALTQGMSAAKRLRIAIRSCLTAIIVLLVFGFAGEAILDFVGISMAAFRISGGILLFLTALDMLFERRTKRREDKGEEDVDDPSIFPLSLPLIAGPGAMTTMILLMGAPNQDVLGYVAISSAMIAVIGVVFILFLGAGLMERLLGDTGIKVITRLLGMLLAALSIQFVLDGLRDVGIVGI